MKGIFVSDLHASLRLPYAKVDQGGMSSDRLRDVIAVIDHVRDHAWESGATFVAIVGDLFDEERPDGPTLIAVSRALRSLANVCQVLVLPGNHDCLSREGRMYTLQFYGELAVPRLRVLGHETVDIKNVALHAVPWVPDETVADLVTARLEQKGDGPNVLLFHQDVVGATWDSGMSSSMGIDREIFKPFDFAVGGHYHIPQELGDPHYVFCGSPLALRFGDEAVGERSFVEIDFDCMSLRRIPHSCPTFGTIDVDAEEAGANFSWADYTRFIVRGSPDRVVEVCEHIRHLPVPDSTRYWRIDPRPVVEAKSRMDVSPVTSHEEMLRRYVQLRGEGDPALLAVGVGLMEGV